MAIFEERGLFWWADEAVPEKQFAPDSCVAGLLIIGDDGRTRLELDGYFPSKHGPMTPMMRRGQLIDKDIQGLLKTSNKRVLLSGLTGGGGQFSTNGLSYERYIAGQCLVADGFAKPPATCAFKELIVPLAGFEEWLRLAAIKVTSSNRTGLGQIQAAKGCRLSNRRRQAVEFISRVPGIRHGRCLAWRFP